MTFELKKKSSNEGEVLTAPPPANPIRIPPLRTFVVTRAEYDGEGKRIKQVVNNTHWFDMQENGALTFTVLFLMDTGQPAQVVRYAIAANEWVDIEEINLAFPELVKH